MPKTQYGDLERRKYFRHSLIYSPRKATLSIGNLAYRVFDISQGGLRFADDNMVALKNHIRGILTFSDGETRIIEGTIVWKQDKEIGLKFDTLYNDFSTPYQ